MKKSKSQLLRDELAEHGTPERFRAIKKAKTPKELAETIVRQHGSVAAPKPAKKCRRCGKLQNRCDCK